MMDIESMEKFQEEEEEEESYSSSSSSSEEEEEEGTENSDIDKTIHQTKMKGRESRASSSKSRLTTFLQN